MGSVRLTERHVRSRPAEPQPSWRRCATAIDAVLDEAERGRAGDPHARTLVSVAGTATTLQAIALGLERYDPERDASHLALAR